MHFSVYAMANIGNDEAAKEAKILALAAALKDHREALHFIPEIFEQFTALQSNEYKATLIEKKTKDLEQKVESLLNDNEVKDKRGSRPSSLLGKDAGNHSATLRIIEKDDMLREKDEKILMLEQKLEEAKVDKERKRELISSLQRKLETMKSTKLEKGCPDTQAHERSIQAMKDRYEEMKHELNIKDQKLKEKEDKFLLFEKWYNSTIHNKDSDLEQMKLRYDELNHVLNTKDQELKDEKDKFLLREKEYNSVIHNKDRDIEQMKLRLQQLQKDYNSTIHSKDSDTERLKIRINELEHGASSALRCKDWEIEQLKSRIASISDKKVRQDQSRVENTLSMNRQSKLEEDFKLFVDEARMDACERIQLLCKSNEDNYVRIYYPRLACLIFEAAYEQAKQAKQAFGEICKDVSSSLIHSAPDWIHRFLSFRKKRYLFVPITFRVGTSMQDMEYPTDVVDAIFLSLKESATAHNVTFCVTDVQNTVRQKWHSWFQDDRWFKPDEKIIRDPQILSYIEKCIKLTWRMVTQVPAMTLEYQSKYLERDFHTVVTHRSSRAMYNNTAFERQEIALYIWPGLRDGQGTVIRRGDVICKVTR
ncbi:myosin heavy chain, clone 203-like isoform X4 [Acropora muricata]|uniref:myosin heavy chain, clone 203-like isoform X4 n=1 Tax=Acropora muricata TaxID=159855 RepID=UPI0034E530C0